MKTRTFFFRACRALSAITIASVIEVWGAHPKRVEPSPPPSTPPSDLLIGNDSTSPLPIAGGDVRLQTPFDEHCRETLLARLDVDVFSALNAICTQSPSPIRGRGDADPPGVNTRKGH